MSVNSDRVHVLYETRTNNVPHLLKESAWEWVALIFILGGAAGLELVQPFERVAFANDINIAYPLSPQTVPNWMLAALAVGVPILTILIISLAVKRSSFDAHQSVLGLAIALAFTLLFTQIVKVSTGSLRPDFLDRCKPTEFVPEFVADARLFRVKTCSGDPRDIKEGRKSFFSGHSSLAWAGLGFLSLYLSRHLNFQRKPLSPKYAITVIPVIIALLISISRVDNYWHRWQDVVVGAVVGATVATYCYRYHCAPLEDLGREPDLPHHRLQRVSSGAPQTDFLATGRSRSDYDNVSSNESLRFNTGQNAIPSPCRDSSLSEPGDHVAVPADSHRMRPR
ncbi:phosphatidic acid phosphatase type 2/haloperoxidase [Powellomyces hirtus]|nr:phosphatidic acid phosphatase type 2/haloperoxidase [Powellomyces hirtus]